MNKLPYLLLLLLPSCATKTAIQNPKVPEVPWYVMRVPTPVSRVGKFPETQPGGFVLSWQNTPTPFGSNYQTRVETTLDFRRWTLLATLPYAASGSLVVEGSPTNTFFRAGNSIKPPP